MKTLPTTLSLEATEPAVIKAGETDGDGKQHQPTFAVDVYTGGAVTVNGWDLPVVLDLEQMKFGRSLIANLDHDSTKRVGHVTAHQITDNKLVMSGVASAASESRREVVESASGGFPFQASIEANPDRVVEVAAGETVSVNGQDITGPFYRVNATTKGFAFLSHGADDNTAVTIAATAAHTRESNNVKPEVKAWVIEMGLDPSELNADQIAKIEADYAGRQQPKPTKPTSFEAIKAEATRKKKISDLATERCEDRYPDEVEAILAAADEAIKTKQSFEEFRYELMLADAPNGHIVRSKVDSGLSDAVIEAAICQAGGMKADRLDAHFPDQVQQAAHDRFKGGIGLNQVFFEAARAVNHSIGYERRVTPDILRAAFQGNSSGRSIQANQGYSTMDISTILSNVANKFLRDAWNYVEQSWSLISTIRPVNDFKEITTTSLTADLTFRELGAGGTIEHGTAGEEVYANKADTYARMFAITRTDFINDDLGALTAVPRKLGRGGALKLNNLFWTAFMDNATFFSSANGNLLEGTPASDLSRDGLNAAETAFDAQTDPEGEPLGSEAAILLVPSSLYNTALELMGAVTLAGQGADAAPVPNANVYAGRYRVVKSRYLENASYTGNSATAWYLLADPMDLPVIEVAALNGQVTPTVDSADADFNTLGVQMRGYSDVGVRKQEYRGGNKSTGAA